jgi:hypothetical protein
MTPPPQQPSDRPLSRSYFEGYDIVIEGPMDLTRRPRRPGIPYTAPDAPLTNPPRKDGPPARDEASDQLSPEEPRDSAGDAEPAA